MFSVPFLYIDSLFSIHAAQDFRLTKSLLAEKENKSHSSFCNFIWTRQIHKLMGNVATLS